MRRPVRWIVGSAVGVLLLAGAGYWNAVRVAEDSLEEGRREFHEEVAWLRARRLGRPALLQPQTSGDASAIYEELAHAIDKAPEWEVKTLAALDPADLQPEDEANDRVLCELLTPALVNFATAFHRPFLTTVTPEVEAAPLGKTDPSAHRAALSSQVLLACGHLERRAGRLGSAISRWTEAWLLAQDQAHGATLHDAFWSQYRANEARAAIAEVVGKEVVPTNDLRALAERLEALARARVPLTASWRVERSSLVGVLSDDAIWSKSHEAHWALAPAGDNLWSTRIARSLALVPARRLPTELSDVATTQLGLGRFTTAFPECRSDAHGEVQTACFRRWEYSLRWQRIIWTHAAVLELAVALARFEADHGVWPTAARDLVPHYMSRMPESPFDPMGLRHVGNRAWSRGPDEDDDGGRPLSAPYESTGDGDIVVEVKGHH